MAEPLIMHGDMLTILPTLDAESVDSCVTDPPYHLTSGNAVYDLRLTGSGNPRQRRQPKGGFMGKQWDGGDIAFRPETWAEVYRVLKPGAHLIAFSGTRTYHRMACAIEDAGFEIRDQIGWLYGSGFPKSHDVSKGIDRAAGAERTVVGRDANFGKSRIEDGKTTFGDYAGQWNITAPATDAARQWEGWGTALKPAWEPIVLARKPLIGTVAANVLKHGTGAINVDGCRVDANGEVLEMTRPARNPDTDPLAPQTNRSDKPFEYRNDKGRWPANIIHDGSAEVLAAFPDTDSTRANGNPNDPKRGKPGMWGLTDKAGDAHDYRDTGSAARFFYTAKADSDDRLGSKHPTVKPVDLMAYLCRLVTPPGRTVLDPFAGSGTTGMACMREGFDCILIEREAEYVGDIKRRLVHVRGEDKPLFAGVSA